MQSPNYRDDPEHYKRLIAKINEEANFPMYLHQNGYKLAKKSAGSMEFRNDKDRIVLQINRSPVTYFNRNDSHDKGLFFKYLMQRSPNFYKAVKAGLEIVNRTYDLENTTLEIKKRNTITKSLEENYNIVPLRNSNYLRVQRGISKSTLNDPLFKGRIFNAYHVKDNGGKFANIAFPKYDLDGTAKNYILYNRPYRSKKDNEIKKFRLVLNRKDHFLFHSKPIKNPSRIVVGESAIDLLSYHEIHGKPDNLYVSFAGNVYQEKLQFFGQLTEPFLKTNDISLVSIMDNDIKGHEFDLKVFTSLINRYNPNIYVESSFRANKVCLNIHYTEKVRGQLARHATILSEKLTSDLGKDDLVSGLGTCVAFSDKILLEFSLPEVMNTYPIEQEKNVFKTLVDTMNGLYLPFATNIHKSNGKDWNDDLRASKKAKYVKMDTVIPKTLTIGDKIELKTLKGPEGTTNIGTIKIINGKSLECDFGLKYTYAVPFSAIGAHLKKTIAPVVEKGTKELQKNNNIQNHIL